MPESPLSVCRMDLAISLFKPGIDAAVTSFIVSIVSSFIIDVTVMSARSSSDPSLFNFCVYSSSLEMKLSVRGVSVVCSKLPKFVFGIR